MWIKKGLIFKITKKKEWMSSHTALPFADRIRDSLFRIYFSTRDSKNRAATGFIELDLNDTSKILKISKKPVLSYGKIGTFDENGVMSSCIVNFRKKKFLFYTGWSSSKFTPFNWSIGLAISENEGKTFEKFSEGPIISQNIHDPVFVGSPTVILERNLWKMWYISSKGWKKFRGSYIAPYFLKYAESKNGIDWKITDEIAIPLKPKEIGLGRASVIKDRGIYKMWYSYSKKNYRIGYAESKNGKKWKRMDNYVRISNSNSGWDSESIEYPYVFESDGIRYMLYNGNNYGKTGIGYAIYSN
jgi:predicted GH43/DUF377 family glycosyl hydrolase